MSRVLQTYDDGSELTVKGFAVTVAVGFVAAAAATGGVMLWNNISDRRLVKKYQKTHEENQ